MIQIAVAVWAGAVLAAASVLGVIKFSNDERDGRPTKRHHLIPMILGCAGLAIALIASAP